MLEITLDKVNVRYCVALKKLLEHSVIILECIKVIVYSILEHFRIILSILEASRMSYHDYYDINYVDR